MKEIDPGVFLKLRAHARVKGATIIVASPMEFRAIFPTREDAEEAIAKFINAATGTLVGPNTVSFKPK